MPKDYKDTYKRIAEQLIAIRKQEKYSKYRMAQLTEMAPNSIAKIEKGEEGYHIDSLLMYLEALGVEFPNIEKE